MADIGALMVVTFGRFLAPLLVMAHTANHVAMSKKQVDIREQVDEVMTEQVDNK